VKRVAEVLWSRDEVGAAADNGRGFSCAIRRIRAWGRRLYPWIINASSRVLYRQRRNGPFDAFGEKGCERGHVEINARAVQGAKVARAVLYSYDSPRISTEREHGVH
jgi:hypothetical protein